MHLAMPGLDVIGAGEPMVPGVSMGHNGTAAFALTIFGADRKTFMSMILLQMIPTATRMMVVGRNSASSRKLSRSRDIRNSQFDCSSPATDLWFIKTRKTTERSA
ncbi:hypothetical protein AJ88_35915 [Mesorhizobium amorphae CCBAU 01583]|nr:hypothetical protein AJ88_35915 [Mesorhizobium amorphae CCBAU 01583]